MRIGGDAMTQYALPVDRGRDHSTGVIVRPVRDEDDLDALNAGNEGWWGQRRQRELFRNVPADIPCAMLIGELDDAAVGYAHAVAGPAAALGYGLGSVYVLPHARQHGVGRRLFDAVVDVAVSGDVPGVMLTVQDGDAASLDTAYRWGLEDHGHHFESVLELATLSDEIVKAATTRAYLNGYTIAALPAAASEDIWRTTHSFLAERFHEGPDWRDGGGAFPYEIFRTFATEPWQVLLACHGGEPAGVTAVTVRLDAPHRVNTFFTGVHPEHRGRGLSTALKAVHARMLRDAGWRELWTQNMEVNAPILAANARLGFRKVGGYVDVGLALR